MGCVYRTEGLGERMGCWGKGDSIFNKMLEEVQEEVQHLWRYKLYSQGKYFNALTSLVLVHAGCLFCNGHSLNTNYYRTPFDGMPGSFNSSPIDACIMGIGVLGPRFIVSSEGQGLHKMLPPRGFEPSTYRMPGKRRTTRLQLLL